MLDETYYNISKDLPYLLTCNDIVVDVGCGFSVLTEHAKEDILGKPIFDIFKLIRLYPDIYRNQKNKKKYYYIFTKSLEPREVSFRTKKCKNNSEVLYVFSELPDSTFEERQSFIQQMYKDNHIGIAVYSYPDFILLKANKTYFDVLHIPNKLTDIIGLTVEDFISWNEESEIKRILKDVVDTGKTTHTRRIKALDAITNKHRYYESTITAVKENGSFKYVVCMLNNITDREIFKQEKEKEIKLQKEQLEVILDNISEELYIIDKNRNYLKVNKNVRERHKHFEIKNSSDFFERYKYYDLSGNEINYDTSPTAIVVRGEEVKNFIAIAVDPDKRYICCNGEPILDEENNLVMGVLTIRNITNEIESKNELEEALEMKDEFLSLISHEFKTPINVINSAIQAIELLCKNEMSEKLKGFISKIKQNSLRQLRLVNNLLDITRVNAGQIKIHKKNLDIVFLTKAITESVYLYSRQKGLKLTFTSKFGQKFIGIDDEKYERILLNLLSNAIKFTPEGRLVTLKLSSRKGYVCIEVKDNGVGIPKDKLELIFERFGQVDSSLTRQAEGTGIGLSLVKLFVETLGGSISVKSKVGKGSTFTILLPSEIVKEDKNKKVLQELTDNRLIQTTSIEFSDIYL